MKRLLSAALLGTALLEPGIALAQGTALPRGDPPGGVILNVEERRRLQRERLGVGAVGPVAAPGGSVVRRLPVRLFDIRDKAVYNFRGERLGEVERVLINPADNRHYAILSHGGLLGLGEEEIALPLERFGARGDDLFLRGVTEEDLEGMENWQRRLPQAREVDPAATAPLRFEE